MITMRFARVAVLAAVGFCVGFSAPARAAGADEASAYITGVANQALATITEKNISAQNKQAKLDRLFADNVDFPWVGRFVMGRFWREASDTQKTRYLSAYQKFLTLHYTKRFTEYTSGQFKVIDARDDGEDEFTVSMQIKGGDSDSGDEPVLVDYRVRKEDKGFKVFDIIVEGVSMITTQRSEFSSVLSQNGIDYLISQLETKSRTGDLNMADSKSSK